MARRSGLTQSAGSRIWRAFALEPHRSARTFKLSKDPLFIEKVRDWLISSIRPTRPWLLALMRSRAFRLWTVRRLLCQCPGSGREAHPRLQPSRHHRPVFAALEVATGRIIARCQRRHRSGGFPPLPGCHRRLGARRVAVHLHRTTPPFTRQRIAAAQRSTASRPLSRDRIVAQRSSDGSAADRETTQARGSPQHVSAKALPKVLSQRAPSEAFRWTKPLTRNWQVCVVLGLNSQLQDRTTPNRRASAAGSSAGADFRSSVQHTGRTSRSQREREGVKGFFAERVQGGSGSAGGWREVASPLPDC